MTVNKILVSVVMSVYNESRYLNLAIKSILKQSFSNFEFIIVDDYSSKTVKKILAKYKKKDKRIKIISNPKNLGLTKSLYKAIRHAKGKYVARIDSDDFSLKYRLEKQFSWLEASSKRVMCGTNFYLLNNNLNLKKMNIEFGNENIKRNMIFKNCFQHSSVMFRLSTYKKIGGYDKNLKYSQDYALWSRFIQRGKVDNLKDRLIIKRDHKNSISSKYLNEQTLYSIFISCNNFNYKKNKFFFNTKKTLKENLLYLNKKKFLYFFYQSLIFLNRKKLDKKYYLSFLQLHIKSLFYCILQPKMFLYTLV